MKHLITVLALLFTQQSVAVGTTEKMQVIPISPKLLTHPPTTGTTISCTVIVITEAETFEKKFKANVVSQGHNVPEVVVEGKHTTVTAMADGKWLGLSWSINGELVAESINLIRDAIEQPRVLIQYNPKNVAEQISLDCSK